jgi:hypothetical protein
MEITKERKKEIVELILKSSGPVHKFTINEKNFPNEKEKNFIKEKLNKYPQLELHFFGPKLSEIKIKDLESMFETAKRNNTILRKKMKRAIKKETSFVERNVLFLILLAFFIPPFLSIPFLPPFLCMPLPFLSPMVALLSFLIDIFSIPFLVIKLITEINDSTLGLSKKMEVELRTILTYELEIN